MCKNCKQNDWIAIIEGFSYYCKNCGRVDVDGEQLDEEESQKYKTTGGAPKSWGGFGAWRDWINSQ